MDLVTKPDRELVEPIAAGLPTVLDARGGLARYDEACRAIAAAKSIDEVKEIHDRAEAMRAYARQAKNRELEVDAAEIRMRAERRLGELIIAQKTTVGLRGPEHSKGGGSKGSKREPLPEAPPTLAEVGIDKKLSSRAQKLARVPDDKFEGMLDQWRERIEQDNERVALALLKQGGKAERRAAREAELAAKIRALPDKRYGVIVADPEWRFEPWSRKTGMDRAADNHYPTSPIEVIAGRDVESIAADDCILFLWATQPMERHAHFVMEAWGFDYRTQIIWRKLRPGEGRGTGYWFINEHKILLVGIKGYVPAPTPGTQFKSVIEAPVSEHSAKPEIFLEIIEQYFPTVPKIELNRRGAPRPGWDAWGNEATALSLAGCINALSDTEAEPLDLEAAVAAAPPADDLPPLPACLRRT